MTTPPEPEPEPSLAEDVVGAPAAGEAAAGEAAAGEAAAGEAAAAPPPPLTTGGGPTREYRARWAFSIIAAFLLAVYLLVLFQAGALIGPSSGAFLGGTLAIAANMFAAVGLGWRRDWARYAMTPLLWVTVVAGLLQAVLSFTNGTLTIPIGALLASWALYARPSASLGPLPASSSQGTFLVIVALVAALLAFF